MRNLAFFLIIILIIGCTKPIIYKNYNREYKKSIVGYESDNRFIVDEKVNPNLKQIWNSGTYGSYDNCSFSALDTLLMVPDLGGRITAFHTETGKKIGELKYEGEIGKSIIVNKSRLYFLVNDYRKKYSNLVFYDLTNGKELNSIELIGKYNTNLIFIHSAVIAVSEFGKISKINMLGKIVWQIDLKRNIYTNSASDGKSLFLADNSGNIMSLDLADGRINYNSKISEGFQSGIYFDDKSIYTGDNSGIVYSVNSVDGNVNWTFNTGNKIIAAPTVDNKYIFIGNLNGDFFCINKINGNLIWSNKLGGVINTAPLIFNNIILQSNLQKRLDILDKFTGDKLSSIEFDGRVRTSPLYYNKKIYLGVDKGEVYCYLFDQ